MRFVILKFNAWLMITYVRQAHLNSIIRLLFPVNALPKMSHAQGIALADRLTSA